MLIDLNDERAEDPGQTGAKAAWLARGLRAGLPVLPGIVVPTGVARDAMARGVEVMAVRGSGGARLSISQESLPEDLVAAMVEAAGSLGDPLVVRSSSVLEGGGEWSGAFTSYLDIHPDETPVAVRGCWASAFTVHTLERYEAVGIEPGSAPMAVLIQPALDPDFGGIARLTGGEVTVIGVAGSPAPLVQGWDPGSHALVSSSGAVRGDGALELMGMTLIDSVAATLRAAYAAVGANSCEWASVDGEVTLLQLMRSEERPAVTMTVPQALFRPEIDGLVRLVRRFPGPLGEELVLPWAVAAPDRFLEEVAPADLEPFEALTEAIAQVRTLVAEVWHGPKPQAADRAAEALRDLRSDAPDRALLAVAGLAAPDSERASLVLSLLRRARNGLVEAGAVSQPALGWHLGSREALAILRRGRASELRTRIGFDRWEPFDAAVVIARDRAVEGLSAAPGIAVGRLCFISDPRDSSFFRPRDVVVGTHPLPNLAALLWDASALVTTGGGPAAHLFESARALALPAVASVHLEGLLGGDLKELNGRFSLAVDGTAGRVWAHEW